MPVRPIVRLGHPTLRTPAEPVDPTRLSDPQFQTLIDDMVETMFASGGVGLAAPQLGIGLQLFVYAVIDLDADTADDDDNVMDDAAMDDAEADDAEAGRAEGELPEVKVLINPAIDPRPGELVYDWEGCLSISDLRGLVPRHPEVRVHALGRDGQPIDYLAEGYEARIIQHEYDHLNGVVFLDRMRDLRSLAFGAEWEEFLTESSHEDAQVG